MRHVLCWLGRHDWDLDDNPDYPGYTTCRRCGTEHPVYQLRWTDPCVPCIGDYPECLQNPQRSRD